MTEIEIYKHSSAQMSFTALIIVLRLLRRLLKDLFTLKDRYEFKPLRGQKRAAKILLLSIVFIKKW